MKVFDWNKQGDNNPEMTVPDELVIEALLKDAKRFKSKWELHTNEPTRAKPNVLFLKRTLSNVVKINRDRMRKSRKVQDFKQEMQMCASKKDKNSEKKCELDSSHSPKDSAHRRSEKFKNYSKPRCRSPERRKHKETSNRNELTSNSRHSLKK